MRISLIVSVCVSGLLLVGCDNDNTAKNDPVIIADNSTNEIASGPEFDLISTPVGDVNFPVSCNATAAPLVERGVALMHHMMYDEAGFVFSMADDEDTNCAMAYWGQAMSLIHPLWNDPIKSINMERGATLIQRAKSIDGTTEREKDYIKSLEEFFVSEEIQNQTQGYANMAEAFKDMNEKYTDDMDAQAYRSLFIVATAYNNPQKQRQAALLALDILNKIPNHPGGHHYTIHAYDTADLAELALETADNYGRLTPRIPHATHMMTHTYTRLGEWDKAITWNKVSADSALELCLVNGEINQHYTHALDYLMYAYLQKGDDEAAAQVLKDAHSLDLPFGETALGASAYAYSALPARFALERRDWQAAVKLEPRMPASLPWTKAFDPFVANTHFARALAFSHLGRAEEATKDIDALNELRMSIAPNSEYWSQQVEIQAVSAAAWQQYAMDNKDQALATMKQAFMLESTTDKHAITPGEVLPAAELYGDMLRESGQFEEALVAYDAALKRAPGKYNSLYGAAQAAMASGDKEAAKKYFGLLIINTKNAGKARKELTEILSIYETL